MKDCTSSYNQKLAIYIGLITTSLSCYLFQQSATYCHISHLHNTLNNVNKILENYSIILHDSINNDVHIIVNNLNCMSTTWLYILVLPPHLFLVTFLDIFFNVVQFTVRSIIAIIPMIIYIRP